MSAARLIQGGIVERLKVFPFFSQFTFAQNQSHQVMPTDLPYCAVYQLPESQAADGDLNAGEPRFKSDSIIGISIILRNIEPDELEIALDTAFDVIMIGLLQDPSFIGFRPAGQYDIEGVSRVKRQLSFGVLGNTNEMPIGELRVELTFITRYDYPPEIVDWLKVVHLETVYPSVEAAPSTQQIVAEWDLPTGSPGDSP
jgi:hypothetical protein